jgi:hypothetical protein
MSIRPVELNGIIQRADHISSLKQQEDSKPYLDQQNIQSQVDRKKEAMKHQVVEKGNTPEAENHADAREEGRGVYYAPSGKKKTEEDEEERKPAKNSVVAKSTLGGTLDIKI